MQLHQVTPGKTRLGWIGTGVMGRSMCGHLIDRGLSMTVSSRTKSKADALLANVEAEQRRVVTEESPFTRKFRKELMAGLSSLVLLAVLAREQPRPTVAIGGTLLGIYWIGFAFGHVELLRELPHGNGVRALTVARIVCSVNGARCGRS